MPSTPQEVASVGEADVLIVNGASSVELIHSTGAPAIFLDTGASALLQPIWT